MKMESELRGLATSTKVQTDDVTTENDDDREAMAWRQKATQNDDDAMTKNENQWRQRMHDDTT